MEEKPHILYVDDERQNLVSFRASFRKYYHIHVAQSGEEALDLLRAHPIVLIISDQRMPRMTGVQLFEKILPEFPDTVRMVLTGYSDIEAIIDAINKGNIYYYITKPWDHHELHMVIEKGLEAHRLKMENRLLLAERAALKLKAEKQEKEHLLSQFETLKNQVNPHFLFNCLNSLSSLVYEDPSLAEDFIAKLTKVYRYVLDVREEILVPLRDEYQFMQSYFFLQKIRFEANLQLRVDVDEQVFDWLIPPLTLQILAENAIKHNVISRDHPLSIELFSEGEFLIMRNNYQKREDRVDSTGIGLRNLRDRYRFLSHRQPRFDLVEDHYIARVPLLHPEREENAAE